MPGRGSVTVHSLRSHCRIGHRERIADLVARIVTPTGALSTYVPVLINAIEGVCVNGVSVGSSSRLLSSSEVSVTVPPVGVVPVASAWLVTPPALISARVIV